MAEIRRASDPRGEKVLGDTHTVHFLHTEVSVIHYGKPEYSPSEITALILPTDRGSLWQLKSNETSPIYNIVLINLLKSQNEYE